MQTVGGTPASFCVFVSGIDACVALLDDVCRYVSMVGYCSGSYLFREGEKETETKKRECHTARFI